MNHLPHCFLIFSSFFTSSALFADHHHHEHHSHDNPPCNHESLEEARHAERAGH